MCISFSFLFRPENQFLTEVGSLRVDVPPPPPTKEKPRGSMRLNVGKRIGPTEVLQILNVKLLTINCLAILT